MAAAADYLSLDDPIMVVPRRLWATSGAISTIGELLMTAAGQAMAAVEDLNEDWISGSAAQALDFTRKLKDDLIDLFGTGDASSPGALATYAGFLRSAAGAFDMTEMQLQLTWADFVAGVVDPSSDGDSSVSSDSAKTAVTYS